MPPLLQLQKLSGKGNGGLKKASLHRFLADQKIASSWGEKNAFFRHPIARATSFACCQTHSDYSPAKLAV